jgi:iron-sulfur cluster assembly protein
MTASVLTLTERAAERVKRLIENSPEEGVMGLRVGIKTRGCSGLSYFVEYAKEQKKFEDVVEDKGVRILIDPKAVLFLLGTEMDYKADKLQAQFIFNNPNQVSACGCGESVQLTPAKG